jgi:hypothetical protein
MASIAQLRSKWNLIQAAINLVLLMLAAALFVIKPEPLPEELPMGPLTVQFIYLIGGVLCLGAAVWSLKTYKPKPGNPPAQPGQLVQTAIIAGAMLEFSCILSLLAYQRGWAALPDVWPVNACALLVSLLVVLPNGIAAWNALEQR